MFMLDVLTQLNNMTFWFVKDMANSSLNVLMAYWAYSYALVIPVIVLYMLYKKDIKFSTFIFAFVALFIIAEVLKMIFREPRPCTDPSLSWINQVGCESGYSFPSNHATVLGGLFVFLKKYKYIRAGYIVWMLITLFGRVYLGQHYPTDVIAGFVISVVLCYAIDKNSQKIEKLAARLIAMVPFAKRYFYGTI